MTYKVTIQYTPFELVYKIQPMMPTEYMVPTQWIQDEPNDDIEVAIIQEDLSTCEHQEHPLEEI
jgi:hypothetical protein